MLVLPALTLCARCHPAVHSINVLATELWVPPYQTWALNRSYGTVVMLRGLLSGWDFESCRCFMSGQSTGCMRGYLCRSFYDQQFTMKINPYPSSCQGGSSWTPCARAPILLL